MSLLIALSIGLLALEFLFLVGEVSQFHLKTCFENFRWSLYQVLLWDWEWECFFLYAPICWKIDCFYGDYIVNVLIFGKMTQKKVVGSVGEWLVRNDRRRKKFN